MDAPQLERKLALPWSLGSTSTRRQLKSSDGIAQHYHELDRRVKMRVLLSYLDTPDDGRIQASAVLNKAVNDERWVSLIAELVRARLTTTSSSAYGQDRARSTMLADVADTVVTQIMTAANDQQPPTASRIHFEPTELKFLPSTGTNEQAQVQFTYVGQRPDLFPRDRETSAPAATSSSSSSSAVGRQAR